MRAIIVGGGMGGLAAGLSLRRDFHSPLAERHMAHFCVGELVDD